MKTRHGLFLILAGLLGLPLARAAAQDAEAPVTPEMRTRSHLPIPFAAGNPDEAQRVLARHLRRAEDFAGLQKMLNDPAFRKLAENIARNPRKFGVEDQVRELQQSWQGQARPDLQDPRWQELVAKALARQGNQPAAGADIPAEQREAWQGLLRRLAEDAQAGSGEEPPRLPGPSTATPPGRITPGPHPPAPVSPPHPPAGPDSGPAARELSRPTPAQPPEPPAEVQARSRMTQELLKFADRLQSADSSLKKSPALHEFVRSLARYSEPAGQQPAADTDGHLPARLRDRLPQLVEALHLDRLHVDPETWQQARSLLPPAPRVTLHPSHFPRVAPAEWSVPRPTSAEARGGMGQFLLLLAVALGFGVLLWRLLAWQNARRPGRTGPGWRLGPWPVRPNAVRTRAELVQAFDHLALLLLGPVARSWNHLLIAARLGEDRRPDRRQAAAQLARLYEQARYAPPDEVLADDELAAARHHLCLLAGVSAA